MKHDPTADSGFDIDTKTMEFIPTERPDDYIVEDPSRMTRRGMKKELFIVPTMLKTTEDPHIHIEMDRILAMMLENIPTTARSTSRNEEPQPDYEHITYEHIYNDYMDNEESSWIWEPTREVIKKETLPWSTDFNNKMWSNWDDPDPADVTEDETDSGNVRGRKKL
jgi:hypothetical protein